MKINLIAKKLKLLTLVIFVSFFIIKLPIAHAQVELSEKQTDNNFTNTIESTYLVDNKGVTKVTHNIKITNNTPKFYLKQYALKTSYFGLSNIVVKDKNGKKIEANIVSNKTGTSIGITFKDQVVGQGKSRNFYIEYDNHDLATVAGKVLEVHIPKLGDSQSFKSNKTILITPSYFSTPVRVSPKPQNVSFKQDRVISIFERKSGEEISAIYGQEQVYKMTLRYSLENTTSSKALAQISLPPDTPFQKMYYHALDPLPNKIKKDLDGNWIATYRIPPNSATIVHLTAEAKITLDPNPDIPYTSPTKAHTKNLKFWESNDPSIIKKAQLNQTPKQIYDYVVKTLNYSQKELTKENTVRLGALAAFENPNDAVCQEFTDTFIALARANNIPARRLVGIGYTQNSVLRPSSFQGDILHSWPEYYDSKKNLWIQVDPTWGNTTGGIDYFNQFDLNHIVFSINGTSSSLPYPAGSYKIKNEDTKDVEVTIGDSFPKISPKFSGKLSQKKLFFIPIPGMYELYITNDTGQAWYDVETQVTSLNKKVKVTLKKTSRVKTFLPFQRLKFDLTFFTKDYSITNNVAVKISYKNTETNKLLYESKTQTIQAGPQVIEQIQNTKTIIYLGVASIIIALITGSLLVFRQKKSSSLRRKS